MNTKSLIAVAAVVGTVVAAYERYLKPWQERWGATDEEVALRLPGDELVEEPAKQVTRAITIDATREEVWPWIVQLGADRGGFYTYDRLENLVGLDIHSADEIVDEWQDLEIGDVVHADRARTGGSARANITDVAQHLIKQSFDQRTVCRGRDEPIDGGAIWNSPFFQFLVSCE